MRHTRLALAAVLTLWLTGCDMLGIESTTVATARREAEGKAIGGACRHAARSIEQCYALNKRAEKSAVFTGWREMNDYMRENNIAAVPPPPETKAAEAAHADDEHGDAAEKPAAKAGAKKGG